jgi:hypothetical protein
MKIEIRLFAIKGDARFNDHSARNQTRAVHCGLIFDPVPAHVLVLKFSNVRIVSVRHTSFAALALAGLGQVAMARPAGITVTHPSFPFSPLWGNYEELR